MARYEFIKKQNTLSKRRLFHLFDVSSSGYYAYLKRLPSQRTVFNQQLDKKIETLFEDHRHLYGYRRLHVELLEEGYCLSRERVRRRMHKLHLKAKQRKKYKQTTDSNHNKPVAENILDRHFTMDTPNQAWVCDITYIKVNGQWLYLAIVLDLYSRKIIGWAMDLHMESSLVCQALTMALLHRGYPSKVIVHSDRGGQYCSDDYQAILTAYGLTCSMSRKGNCWDNAVAESFFHTLKTEWIYRHKLENMAQAKSMILWYIEVYYNRVRKHSYLNYLSPVQFEEKMI
ncbi:IS3 family transposase [Orbus mooreae]|uniref:IS3 family transposase n=1 Tax=Orbus mooreae TaxID=3074107 RepID=UPI00370D8708